MNRFHPRLSCAILSSCFHVSPFTSCSVLLLQVFLGLPLLRLPCGFQVSACLVIAVLFFLNVCPIQLHFLLNSCTSIGSCLVRSHRLMLVMRFGQKTLRIRLRQWLMNVCSFLVMLMVVLQVSDPYSSTDLTLELKILSLVLSEMFWFSRSYLIC